MVMSKRRARKASAFFNGGEGRVSYRDIYTLEEAREMLALWKAAERALASGQVKEYTIGTRTLKMIDMKEIEAQIVKYANIVSAYENDKRTSRTVRVVYRDL